MYLGVWGELASHKRSSTHCPSSQGWASKCLVLSVFVGMVWFVHMYMYMGLWASPFFYLSLAGVLYTCDLIHAHEEQSEGQRKHMCVVQATVVVDRPLSAMTMTSHIPMAVQQKY